MCSYRFGIVLHLFNEELETLDKLSKNNNLVVQTADKGNSVVLLDRDGYVNQMENIL